MITLKIIDGALVAIDPQHAPLIKPALQYKDIIQITVRRGKRHIKERKEVPKYAWAYKSKDMWCFFRGNLKAVIAHLDKKQIEYRLEGKSKILTSVPPALLGITLRNYQHNLIEQAIKHRRGVIHAATGSGKSAVISGIMSAYPKATVLVLAHSIDVISQLQENFQSHLQEPVTRLSTTQPTSSTRISVATIQSMHRIDSAFYRDIFDIVIVDECHMVSAYAVSKLDKKTNTMKTTGSYAKVLTAIATPYRFGFTATLPTKSSSKMALESFIGPVIGEYLINTASADRVLSKPKIILLKVPKNVAHSNIKTYKDALHQNVVTNTPKNNLIIECAKRLNAKGLSVLILVNIIAHGNQLQDRARGQGMGTVPFVYQEVDSKVRLHTKHALNEKQIMTVIGSNVWKVGIDLPTLGAVIIAGGGKSQIQVIQSIGRGLRKTKTKDEIIIVDIFDPSCKWIAEHFSERLTIYFEQGWMGDSIDDL